MNNRKITTLFILFATTILLGIVGFTIAYFTSSTDFENEFQTGLYQTEATETFTSPENWMPGDTTPKTLTITNTGNVDVEARVCISEKWTSSNGDTLPNEVDGERIAILNLTNTSDWTKQGNCYTYNEVLEPNDTTSSFIESVTFNPKAEADTECTTTTQNGSTTKTCTSTGNGYDNANYRLTFKIQTVQAGIEEDIMKNIQYVNRQVEGEITIGDEVAIGSEHFYVVSSDSSNISLLAKYNLLVGDVYDIDSSSGNLVYNKTLSESDTGYGLQNSEAKGMFFGDDETNVQFIGTVPFSSTNYWDNSVCGYSGTSYSCNGDSELLPEYDPDGLGYTNELKSSAYNSNSSNIEPEIDYSDPEVYVRNNGYTIAYYVENYVDTLKKLGAPSNIKGRLLSFDEAISLGCDDEDAFCSNVDPDNNPTAGTAPQWVYSSSYWMETIGGKEFIHLISSYGDFSVDYFYYDFFFGVRPVIDIKISGFSDIEEDNPSNGSNTNSILYSSASESSIQVGYEIPVSVITYDTPEEAMQAIDNSPFYLKHTIENGIVKENYIEFIITNEMAQENSGMTPGIYAIKYNDSYQENVNIINSAFGLSNCFYDDYLDRYYCASAFEASVYPSGEMSVQFDMWTCSIIDDGISQCRYGK